MKSLLVTFLLLAEIATAQKLVPFPEPISSKAYDWSPVMLPDSSMMIASGRLSEGMWKAHRFVYKGKQWIESPSHLDSLINALMINEGAINFRFSLDYNRMVLTVYQGSLGDTHFYETKFENGHWSFFREILQGNPQLLWHGLSISPDHERMFGTTRKGQLYEYANDNGVWKLVGEVTAFKDRAKEIQQPIALSANSLLFKGTYELSGKEKMAFFFTTRHSDGKWTAPHIIEGVVGSDVSFHPLGTHFYFHDVLPERFDDIGYGPTPTFLQKELQKARSKSNTAQRPVVKAPEMQAPSDRIKPGGKNFALLIGNSDYKIDELDLDNPHKDVERLYSVLTTNYQFEKVNIRTLLNADRNNTFKELFQLRKEITKNDNLLIFYAGHGYFDEQVNQGYWWPVDATPDNPSNWLSNSDLIEQIRGINSAHTLLISDACFSGALFKTRSADDITRANLDIQLLYRTPSRRAMTSGTMNKVPDKSVFFQYLIKYLEENKAPFISAGELFSSIRKTVISNSIIVPQEGVIMNTGDEGGDFIFMRKQN